MRRLHIRRDSNLHRPGYSLVSLSHMAKAALGKGLGALISASSSVSGVSRLPALAQPAPGDVVNRVTLDQIALRRELQMYRSQEDLEVLELDFPAWTRGGGR